MTGDHLRGLGNSISVSIPTDDVGYTGRECPSAHCLGYFKVMGGTGMTGITTCVCPYCGTKDEHAHFWTQDQIAYVKSAAMRTIRDAITKDLKAMEFEVKPPRNTMFGFGMSLKFKPGTPLPLHQYAEESLETHVECERCTLKYAIYGVFGYCPDCGSHNSLGILEANLALAEKMVALASEVSDVSIADKLIENALEDCVSVFDGWGRATSAAFSDKASDPSKAKKTSFQNLRGARKRVLDLFGHDLGSPVSPKDFDAAHIIFQKRHLIAHRMGVVDQTYIESSGDSSVAPGRKVEIGARQILLAVTVLRLMAAEMLKHLESP